MDNYNATLKALRNSMHMTRINQGADCELDHELDMWTKILDGVIKSAENDEAGESERYDQHAEYANAEVRAIQTKENSI